MRIFTLKKRQVVGFSAVYSQTLPRNQSAFVLKLDDISAEKLMSNEEVQTLGLQALIVGAATNFNPEEITVSDLVDVTLTLAAKGEFAIEALFTKPGEWLPIPLILIYRTCEDTIAENIPICIKEYYLKFIKLYQKLNKAIKEHGEQIQAINLWYQSELTELAHKFYADINSQWSGKLEISGLLLDKLFLEWYENKWFLQDTCSQSSTVNNKKKGNFMGSKSKTQAMVLFEKRILTTKNVVIDKLKSLFAKLETSFFFQRDDFSTIEESVSQTIKEFFDNCLAFFDEKIAFLKNKENVDHLTEYGYSNRENIIENLNYYRSVLAEINIELAALENNASDSIEEAEEALEKNLNFFLKNFETVITRFEKNPLLKVEFNDSKKMMSVEPEVESVSENFKKEDLILAQSVFEAETEAEAVSSVKEKDKKPELKSEINSTNFFQLMDTGKKALTLIEKYEKRLSAHDLDLVSLSDKSRYLLITKQGAIRDIKTRLQETTLENFSEFKDCLANWKSTLVLHRSSLFIQKIGSFFKFHNKTKGALLLEKLETLMQQAEVQYPLECSRQKVI